ncbi:MAG TPA: anion permease [Chlamydiales bacterium]|jgi:PiT family inorganic phosphate transporter
MELVILIVLFGLLFDYTNGFHDAANVVSTVIATKALAPLSAIIMAGVLNFIGATQISGVAKTISSGLIESSTTSQITVLAAVVGAILWNLLTWYKSIPSSSSYALIGGLIGASWFHDGAHTVLWINLIQKVLLPMILVPLLAFGVSFVLMKFFLNKTHSAKRHALFRHLQIGSACFVALSHGLNDAQKSMGVITLGLFVGGVIPTLQIPFWVILACAITMGLGTAFGGFRIIRTMGFSITRLDPVQGFAAESSASLLILAASFLGMPVSSTHMIAGSITGVGSAKGKAAVQWDTPKKLAAAWVLTLPGAGLTSALVYWLITHIFRS